jgi:hypothetical protein
MTERAAASRLLSLCEAGLDEAAEEEGEECAECSVGEEGEGEGEEM